MVMKDLKSNELVYLSINLRIYIPVLFFQINNQANNKKFGCVINHLYE